VFFAEITPRHASSCIADARVEFRRVGRDAINSICLERFNEDGGSSRFGERINDRSDISRCYSAKSPILVSRRRD